MVELNRISSRYRIRSPDLYFTVTKPDNQSSSPFLLLQMIQVLLMMSRISFCFYKIVYRLKLDRAAFDDVVQSLVQTLVTPSPITKQNGYLFMWIQVAVLLSYIITAAVFVYYVVQETHLPIAMAILCVDLGFQFGHSVLICLWLLVEMIGLGSVYYLIRRKKMIRKNGVSFL